MTDREKLSPGIASVEPDDAPGAFQALMADVIRYEVAFGVAVRERRLLNVVEQLILSRREEGTSAAVLDADTPNAGRPGASPPDRARPAFPPLLDPWTVNP